MRKILLGMAALAMSAAAVAPAAAEVVIVHRPPVVVVHRPPVVVVHRRHRHVVTVCHVYAHMRRCHREIRYY
jgi:hypothetical protein